MLDAINNDFYHISTVQIPKNQAFFQYIGPKINKNGLKLFLTLNLKDAT